MGDHDDDVPVAKRRRRLCVQVQPAGAGAAAAGIPEDIVEEIILRLPVKSVLRFRSVCKSWRAMVADPCFARLQLRHSTAAERRRHPPSMLVLPWWGWRPQRQQMQGTIGFFRYPGHGAAAELAHVRAWWSPTSHAAAADWDDGADWELPLQCNGLVLVFSMEKSLSSSLMFVCNPATKKLAVVPPGTPDAHGNQSVGFGADESTGKIDMKVVRCFARSDESVGCEVFSLGSPAWRPVADSPCPVRAGAASPCILGAIYWITTAAPTPGMLRFDVRREVFDDFPSPPCVHHDGTSPATATLTELSGNKLCYAHVVAGHTVELWTMAAASAADDGPRWSRHCAVELWRPTQLVVPFADDRHGGIFFNLDLAVIDRYDTQRQVVERVVDMNKEMTYFHSRDKQYYINRGFRWMHHVIQYRESLVSVKAN
uniref:F-box domain-containing protein n=1 Tax=Oryza rufipogon TaxID=4529 RepID=A0A0E0PU35_ORYRU